ncbi:MAG: amidophosphoribosyltransferase, partial [Oscillospiraceae bacterium]|nr:amidophosphoribosyltransferase [Oscillospiraceae bacterium]
MKLHEECAVFGVSLRDRQATSAEAVGMTYNGLLAMQHRGQEGAGIAALQGQSIFCHKKVGLVSEVFSEAELRELTGSLVIGHTRYSTTGANTLRNVQPFVTEFLTGRVALAHNGNITNAKWLRDGLASRGINFEASSDSEVIAALVAYEIRKADSLMVGVKRALSFIEGAFTLVILSSDGKLVAARDRHGFRPLCLGANAHGLAVASESCALDSSGFTLVRDVQPGEIVIIENGQVTDIAFFGKDKPSGAGLCIFEYIYFARSDSIIDKLCVYDARLNMGRILAREHPAEADVVCGVPDSGLEAAAGFAEASGLPLVSGFVKNRYIGRSFIYPTQVQRENAVRLKLNPL